MNVDMKMSGASLVRHVMISHGISPDQIFNNIYKNGTRTVKCYRPRTKRELENLMFAIEHALSHVPVKYYYKLTRGCQSWGAPGFIVKFPADIVVKEPDAIKLAAQTIAYHPGPITEQVIEEILRAKLSEQK